MRAQLHVSERRACAALGQHRSRQRKVPRGRDDEQRLTADIIELARQYGRYGFRVARKLKAIDVIGILSDLFILHGIPARIRSDNGPEFVAKAVQQWIAAVGAKTAYIERGSPWENGYIESFNARLRDERLNVPNTLLALADEVVE